MTGPLASTSLSFMPRESDVTRNGVPPGDFEPARFRGGTPSSFLFSCSSSGHPDRLITWHQREEIRRPLREPARCIPMQISLALGTRHNRRNFMLLRNSTCSSYILSTTSLSVARYSLSTSSSPRPRYLITHPRVLSSMLIFHCLIGKE